MKIHEDLMTAKIRENDAVATTKELRQRLMEMETQNQVWETQVERVTAKKKTNKKTENKQQNKQK